MGIPPKFSTLVTRVSVTTLLTRGATSSHEWPCGIIRKCLPQKGLSTGTLLEDGVVRDSRHGSDRRTGAAPHRGRALARAYAARRARSARPPAACGRERALAAGLPPPDWLPRDPSPPDRGGDQTIKL